MKEDDRIGVYVHIPFCRSKCFYCGFYSVASSTLKEAYINALCREIDLRRDYAPARNAETLYLGGGTPSFLSLDDLGRIVDKLESVYHFDKSAERTIEMNPEDASPDKLKGLRQLGFNRLSLGVQSFNDRILKQINRSHSVQQAVNAVELAAECGFSNIGIDLIIGLPGCLPGDLEQDLNRIEKLPVSHVSVYILSIDSNSVFQKQLEKGLLKEESDDALADRYQFVSDRLKEMGFDHYEISNFSRDGKYSVHNTNYWQQKVYIGFGPSAHSFDLNSRQWNVSNLKYYIESLNNESLNFEREELSILDKYNEYIMTGLRTRWGIDLTLLENTYGLYWRQVCSRLPFYIQNGWVEVTSSRVIRLTEKGWLVSDRIFTDLFVV